MWFFYPEGKCCFGSYLPHFLVHFISPCVGLEAEESVTLYPFFRDVNIMIFFGFGFLMAFLRRYGYSAIGYTMLIGEGEQPQGSKFTSDVFLFGLCI